MVTVCNFRGRNGFAVLALSFLFHQSMAFMPSDGLKRHFKSCHSLEVDSAILKEVGAKRKRRKRNSFGDESQLPSPDVGSVGDFEEELPEFDLDDVVPPTTAAKPGFSFQSEPPITPAQRGSVKPLSSVRELLNDRSLEKQLSFDEPAGTEELPEFSDFVKQSVDQPLGKKKIRQTERRAAAIAVEEEAEGGFFSNLPFIGSTGEEKELKPLKVSVAFASGDFYLSSRGMLTIFIPRLLKMELGLVSFCWLLGRSTSTRHFLKEQLPWLQSSTLLPREGPKKNHAPPNHSAATYYEF
jgi:hypothetical protein